MEETKIYKYPLPIKDEAEIQIPMGAQILTVQTQKGEPYIWALVETDAELTTHRLCIRETGQTFKGNEGKYIGTFQVENGTLVFHVFENYMKNYMETYDTEIKLFIENEIEDDDSSFVKAKDVYDRFLSFFDFTSNDISRCKFIRRFKNMCKNTIYKQVKVNGNPELCFLYINLKTTIGSRKK